MEEKKKTAKDEKDKETEQKKKQEEKLDEGLKETFPASDPPAHSEPGGE